MHVYVCSISLNFDAYCRPIDWQWLKFDTRPQRLRLWQRSANLFPNFLEACPWRGADRVQYVTCRLVEWNCFETTMAKHTYTSISHHFANLYLPFYHFTKHTTQMVFSPVFYQHFTESCHIFPAFSPLHQGTARSLGCCARRRASWASRSVTRACRSFEATHDR